jgi:putative exosortase-associated protein (TIGR04073 family)
MLKVKHDEIDSGIKGDPMRKIVICTLFVLVLGITNRVSAQEEQRSDVIIERMAVKLTRGVTNVGTAIVELPKQIYLSVRGGDKTGMVIGPLKGIGMTCYRAFTGVVETVFFLVPQPGYYDPMIDPEFVWQGWNDPGAGRVVGREVATSDAASGKKGD